MWQKIEHGYSSETTVDAVTLVVGPDFAGGRSAV